MITLITEASPQKTVTNTLMAHRQTVIVVGVARAATLFVDISVLVVTWHRTYRIHRDAAQINVRRPVTTLLLRDGEHRLIC